MAAVNASEEAYKLILKRKRKMEEESSKIVYMVEALDALLGVKDE